MSSRHRCNCNKLGSISIHEALRACAQLCMRNAHQAIVSFVLDWFRSFTSVAAETHVMVYMLWT